MNMERIQEGYRAYTGYVFTAEQAAAYNAAVERAERCPNEANRNGAHNLFNSIAMTPSRRPIERQAVGGWIRETGETITALDAYANRKAALPRLKAIALLAEFDAKWPKADHLDAARHLIENA
jgi:hypothetical protein